MTIVQAIYSDLTKAKELDGHCPQEAGKTWLIPYVLYEGSWTLPDHLLRWLFDQMQEEGTFENAFYDGTVKTADEFVQTMQSPSNFPVFVFSGADCVGFAWLSGGSSNLVFANFCFIKDAWEKCARETGGKLLDYWFAFPGEDGPLYEFIFGAVPSFNKAAASYVYRLGWTYLGTVPQMVKSEYRADRASAEIYYISRFDYVEKEPQAAP